MSQLADKLRAVLNRLTGCVLDAERDPWSRVPLLTPRREVASAERAALLAQLRRDRIRLSSGDNRHMGPLADPHVPRVSARVGTTR